MIDKEDEREKTKRFEVGETINAKTKGVWIWRESIKLKNGEGSRPVIVLDTEGLGACDQH